MSKLDDFLGRLLKLRADDAGISATNEEIMGLEISDIPDFNTQGRVDWLKKKLPFPCEAKMGPTTSTWSFRREK